MRKLVAVLVALVLGVATVNAAETYRSYNWGIVTGYKGIDYTEEEILATALQYEEFDLEAYEAAMANNTIYTFVAPYDGQGEYIIISPVSITIVSLLECDSFSVSIEELDSLHAFQYIEKCPFNNLYYWVNWDGTISYQFVLPEE